jgi:cell division GTPase FtsZ
MVIGLGLCGGRIADEFNRLNHRAKRKRGTEITSGVFAVNTNASDLVGLTSIKADYKHRILIGVDTTQGQGVAGISESAAQIAQEESDKITETIREVKHFYETDAIFLIAGTAGGTGSGALPVLAQRCKQRFPDKKVYAILVLPFEHEEQEERTVYNTAICLKDTSSVTDATFLFGNRRFISEDHSLEDDYIQINQNIAEPFYNLLCAGEEKRKKHIGSKLIDAGDIIQTLLGWTVTGYGRMDLPLIRMPAFSRDFLKTSSETNRGIRAMDEAIGEVSRICNPSDAAKALYLVSAPTKELNVDLIKELGDYLKNVAPNAVIRSGDYPTERGAIEVTVLLSQLNDVEKVRESYIKSGTAAKQKRKKSKSIANTTDLTEKESKRLSDLI